MLVKKYYQNNGKAVYECDRCKKLMDTHEDNRYRIVISSTKSRGKVIRGYDLCKHCCSIIVHYIEKGITKK